VRGLDEDAIQVDDMGPLLVEQRQQVNGRALVDIAGQNDASTRGRV